jgi:hypothetical protein
MTARLDCTQPACNRNATLVVRAIAALSHPGHPTCTRCAGSVILRVGGTGGTMIGPAPADGVLAPRYRHFLDDAA